MTRTYTVYFDEKNVAVLKAEEARLRADFQDRERFISRPSVAAMKRRLDALRIAIEQLTEGTFE